MISYPSITNPNIAFKGDEIKMPPVLIVDDEVDICYLLKGILRYRNIDANYVTTLAEAEAHLEKYDPPAIFLDNHLSDGMGMDYISRFKKRHPATHIIMITAYDTSIDSENAYKAGADFFIGKPFTRETILKTIDKIDLR